MEPCLRKRTRLPTLACALVWLPEQPPQASASPERTGVARTAERHDKSCAARAQRVAAGHPHPLSRRYLRLPLAGTDTPYAVLGVLVEGAVRNAVEHIESGRAAMMPRSGSSWRESACALDGMVYARDHAIADRHATAHTPSHRCHGQATARSKANPWEYSPAP